MLHNTNRVEFSFVNSVWDYVKNILGLCKGAISQENAAGSTACANTAQSGCTQQALSSGINWDISFKFLTCKFVYLSDRCWQRKATTHSNKPSRLAAVHPAIHSFYSVIPSLYLNSHWPHDVAWNQGINRDLGPACSWPLMLGVPTKVPERTKSWLHFSIWTHFLVVVLEFMAM